MDEPGALIVSKYLSNMISNMNQDIELQFSGEVKRENNTKLFCKTVNADKKYKNFDRGQLMAI